MGDRRRHRGRSRSASRSRSRSRSRSPRRSSSKRSRGRGRSKDSGSKSKRRHHKRSKHSSSKKSKHRRHRRDDSSDSGDSDDGRRERKKSRKSKKKRDRSRSRSRSRSIDQAKRIASAEESASSTVVAAAPAALAPDSPAPVVPAAPAPVAPVDAVPTPAPAAPAPVVPADPAPVASTAPASVPPTASISALDDPTTAPQEATGTCIGTATNGEPSSNGPSSVLPPHGEKIHERDNDVANDKVAQQIPTDSKSDSSNNNNNNNKSSIAGTIVAGNVLVATAAKDPESAPAPAVKPAVVGAMKAVGSTVVFKSTKKLNLKKLAKKKMVLTAVPPPKARSQPSPTLAPAQPIAASTAPTTASAPSTTPTTQDAQEDSTAVVKMEVEPSTGRTDGVGNRGGDGRDDDDDDDDGDESPAPPAVKAITLEEILAETSGSAAGAKEDNTNDSNNKSTEEDDELQRKKEEEDYEAFMAAFRQREEGDGTGKTSPSSAATTATNKATNTSAASLQPKSSSNTPTMKLKKSRADLTTFDEDQEYNAALEDEDGPSALDALKEKMRRKTLKPVDHNAVEYLPFRKNLYREAPELTEKSNDEVAALREELEIKVRGKRVPTPLDNWTQAGLSSRVMAVIKHHNWTEPFSIQRQALPAIMSGRDVIGVAKTGSGKTLAFVLPMFRHILDQTELADGEGPIAMVLAPARELAVQIHKEVKKFCKALNIRAVCAYGGATIKDQIGLLKGGCEVLVATPGRLIDLLCTNAGRVISLARVTYLVMDEADRMFDLGFEPQVMRIVNNIRPDRQTVLFSATFPPQVERLAKTVLKSNPIEIVVGGRTKASGSIKQVVEVREEKDKFERLLQLLGLWYEKGNVLVFVDTQTRCDQLFQELMRAGYTCLSLHGGKDQVDRDYTIQDFKMKRRTLMVATSVAGRGLDVTDLVLVVNYSCPNHLEDYIHRIGRTGRAGRKGTAYTFITPAEERFAPDLVKALKDAKQKVPPLLLKLNEEFMAKVKQGQAKFRSSGYRGSGFTFEDNEKTGFAAQKDALLKHEQVRSGIRVDPTAESSTAEAAAAAAIATDAAAGKLTGASPFALVAVGGATAGSTQPGAPSSTVGAGAAGQTAKPKENFTVLGVASRGVMLTRDRRTDRVNAEVEINDYPQNARWKVTQKDMIERIRTYSNCAITSKGEYVAPGRTLSAGQRKVYLLIEGDTEYDVQRCVGEIHRVLDEATREVNFDKGMAHGTGKYHVI